MSQFEQSKWVRITSTEGFVFFSLGSKDRKAFVSDTSPTDCEKI